jgi:small-conductance mechanosensitive channel
MLEAYSLTGNAWLDNAMWALAAAIAAVIASKIAMKLALRFAHRPQLILTVLEKIKTPAMYLLVFLALQFVWEAAPDRLHLMAAVRHATALGVIIALTWLGLQFVRAGVAVVKLLNPTTVAENLHARRLQTQTAVISRALMTLIYVIGVSTALMTFPSVRQIGASLLASAGVVGLIAGLAARPMLSNLIAGMQIALTQPIRLDDVLIVEGEWGRVEEITGAFVVVRLWDERRLIVPLQWFIEHPFQNWTRSSAEILGTVFLWVDYHTPIEGLRAELHKLCQASPDWDGRLALLQVSDASDSAMQLRALVSSTDSSRSWDLRCHVREGLIAFMSRGHSDCLPRLRAQIENPGGAEAHTAAPGGADPRTAAARTATPSNDVQP